MKKDNYNFFSPDEIKNIELISKCYSYVGNILYHMWVHGAVRNQSTAIDWNGVQTHYKAYGAKCNI